MHRQVYFPASQPVLQPRQNPAGLIEYRVSGTVNAFRTLNSLLIQACKDNHCRGTQQKNECVLLHNAISGFCAWYKKKTIRCFMSGLRECGVAHMALPFFSFYFFYSPLRLILVDWLHLRVANVTWPGAVLQIQSTEVQMRRVPLQPREEIRPRIQYKPKHQTRRSACCSWVAAVLQQHCVALRTVQTMRILTPHPHPCR